MSMYKYFKRAEKRSSDDSSSGPLLLPASKQSLVEDEHCTGTADRDLSAMCEQESAAEPETANETTTTTDGPISAKSKQSQVFRDSWKIGRNWLIYIHGKGMYCKLCQKYDMRPFDRVVWNCDPSTRIRLSTVKEHEQSTAHKDAVAREAEAGSSQSVAVLIQPQVNLSTMCQVFAALYFLCKQHIAHTTNYEPLLDLIGFLGNSLKSKIRCGRNATYCSDKAVQEMLYCISELLENNIISALKGSNHFAIMFDETTDCSVIEQLVIRCRFIDSKGELQVRYLKMMDALQSENGDTTISLNAEHISGTVLDFFKQKQIELKHLRGIGTDGAAVMVGRINGVVKRIQRVQLAETSEETCEAVGIHCAAHRLNLAASQAGDHVPYIKKFKAVLRQLYDFYSDSAVRSSGLEAIQKLIDEPQLKVLQPANTRWLSVGVAAERLQTILQTVLISLGREAEERGDARAAGLQKLMSSINFIATLLLFCDVLPCINRLSKTFQTQNINFVLVNNSIQTTINILKKLQQSDGSYVGGICAYIKKLKEAGCDIAGSPAGQRHSSSTSATALDTTEDIMNFLPGFNSSVKQPLLSKLIENIENRFAENDILAAFSIFNPTKLPDEFETYGFDQLKCLATRFGKPYTPNLQIEFDEFKQYMNDHMRTINMEQVLSKLTNKEELKLLYPGMAFFAEIFLVIPPHTADCERDFSQLKLIKTSIRNRMKEETLDALLRITLEGPKVEDFPFDKAVELWASKKSRRINVDC